MWHVLSNKAIQYMFTDYSLESSPHIQKFYFHFVSIDYIQNIKWTEHCHPEQDLQNVWNTGPERVQGTDIGILILMVYYLRSVNCCLLQIFCSFSFSLYQFNTHA